MAKRKTEKTEAEPKTETKRQNFNPFSGFKGRNVKCERSVSGVKLLMKPDEDCILRYINSDDISSKLKTPEPEGSAIVLKFFDGKRFVSMSACFALSDIDWVKGGYYYMYHAGLIETKLQPMNDLSILYLGVEGEEIEVPERIADSGVLTLSDDNIEPVNYKRLNYTLR